MFNSKNIIIIIIVSVISISFITLIILWKFKKVRDWVAKTGFMIIAFLALFLLISELLGGFGVLTIRHHEFIAQFLGSLIGFAGIITSSMVTYSIAMHQIKENKKENKISNRAMFYVGNRKGLIKGDVLYFDISEPYKAELCEGWKNFNDSRYEMYITEIENVTGSNAYSCNIKIVYTNTDTGKETVDVFTVPVIEPHGHVFIARSEFLYELLNNKKEKFKMDRCEISYVSDYNEVNVITYNYEDKETGSIGFPSSIQHNDNIDSLTEYFKELNAKNNMTEHFIKD